MHEHLDVLVEVRRRLRIDASVECLRRLLEHARDRHGVLNEVEHMSQDRVMITATVQERSEHGMRPVDAVTNAAAARLTLPDESFRRTIRRRGLLATIPVDRT